MSHLPSEQLMELSDRALVMRCQNGDRQSFRVLYQRYYGKVRSTLHQLCGETLLDDLVQDVFLKAWQSLPQLRNPEYFGTWLYRISWNVATDQRRRFARQKVTPIESTLSQECLTQATEQGTGALTVLHYQDLVQQGLASLNLEQRAVLILHDLRDLPQKEVADILAVPVGTVKSRLFHARRSLRQFLETQGVIL